MSGLGGRSTGQLDLGSTERDTTAGLAVGLHRPRNGLQLNDGHELTLTIAWGAVSRLDLEPATCGDPQCEADHGYTGSITGDDLSLRISAEADGDEAAGDALAFARALSAATATARR